MMPAKQDTQPVPDREFIELTVTVTRLATLVERIVEEMNGTMRTHGMKEKITIAQMDIEANKQAWREMQGAFGKLEQRIGLNLVELSNSINKSIETQLKSLKEDVAALKIEDNTQRTFIQKITPWFNAFAWLVTLVAGTIVTLILTGKLHITP